jgi:hypothetical protein
MKAKQYFFGDKAEKLHPHQMCLARTVNVLQTERNHCILRNLDFLEK